MTSGYLHGKRYPLICYLSVILPFQIETMLDETPIFRFRRETNHKNRGFLSLLADYISQVNAKDPIRVPHFL
jgi:hypothetical protein